jgi:hypothetical protein
MTERWPFKAFKTGPEIIHLAVMLYVGCPQLLGANPDLPA